MRFVRVAFGLVLAVAAVLSAFSQATAQQFSNRPGLFGLFDEIRFGTVYPVQPSDDSGVTLSGQLYTVPLGGPSGNYWAATLLRPRIHIGGNIATGEDPINQVYAGFTWQFPFLTRFFAEASFGGTWHDGPLSSPGNGLDLGCHWLFRESVGVGVALGEQWRVLASIDHSSHAQLCDGGNSGITHAGVYLGYRF